MKGLGSPGPCSRASWLLHKTLTDSVLIHLYTTRGVFILATSLQGKWTTHPTHSFTQCPSAVRLKIKPVDGRRNRHTFFESHFMFFCLLSRFIYTFTLAILWVLELDTLCSYFTGRRPYFVIKSNVITCKWSEAQSRSHVNGPRHSHGHM